nr:SH3 domain-containing protein [uncultured Celeribacter sp.]
MQQSLTTAAPSPRTGTDAPRHSGIFTPVSCRLFLAALLCAISLGTAAPMIAQDAPVTAIPETTPAQPAKRGPVTNLPLPRFVSLKADEANVRRGPSLSHRIDWVFTHRGYPLEVIAEYGHWRRVRDIEGAVGWIHYSLISGVRTALVSDDTITVYSRSDTQSRINARAEKGAILRLLECSISWCRISAQGQKGWVEKTGLWGVKSGEILE